MAIVTLGVSQVFIDDILIFSMIEGHEETPKIGFGQAQNKSALRQVLQM
jgi:hypothetical protein